MRLADIDDLPAIGALRESVGWGVQDWALRLALEPPDARCLVVEAADQVVAVGSGIAYGRLGFVGNMVVASTQRRRGIGAVILSDVLRFLEERGCRRMELFATPAGRPLYERFGFALTDPSAMVRLPRSAAVHGEPGTVVTEAGEAEVEELGAYDAARFGGDRRRLLRFMAADPHRPLLVAREAGEIAGFAWFRPDGPRVGPFVADRPEVAAAILADAFRRAPDAGELTLNLPTANRAGSDWLQRAGAEVEPWDGRMARGAEIARRDDTIYSNTVGALG